MLRLWQVLVPAVGLACSAVRTDRQTDGQTSRISGAIYPTLCVWHDDCVVPMKGYTLSMCEEGKLFVLQTWVWLDFTSALLRSNEFLENAQQRMVGGECDLTMGNGLSVSVFFLLAVVLILFYLSWWRQGFSYFVYLIDLVFFKTMIYCWLPSTKFAFREFFRNNWSSGYISLFKCILDRFPTYFPFLN